MEDTFVEKSLQNQNTLKYPVNHCFVDVRLVKLLLRKKNKL